MCFCTVANGAEGDLGPGGRASSRRTPARCCSLSRHRGVPLDVPRVRTGVAVTSSSRPVFLISPTFRKWVPLNPLDGGSGTAMRASFVVWL